MLEENYSKYDDLDRESHLQLKRYYVNNFREGYLRCRGFLFPNLIKDFADEITNMEIKEQDVWVCSFPKAGTTWVQEMVWCIVNDLNFEGAEQDLTERFPFLEHSALFNYTKYREKHPNVSIPYYMLNSIDHINKQPSPRFIKSHLPYHMLPAKLQEDSTNAKIVHVRRNIRDTCVSFYHHSKLLVGFQGDLNQFCNLFLNDLVPYTPYTDHVQSYLKQKDKHIIFLEYEDMKKDLKSVVRKTADFLGKKLTEYNLERLVDHLKFENMKNNRAVNFESMLQMNQKYDLVGANGSFIRCGEVGQWKQAFSPSIKERFSKLEKDTYRDHILKL